MFFIPAVTKPHVSNVDRMSCSRLHLDPHLPSLYSLIFIYLNTVEYAVLYILSVCIVSYIVGFVHFCYNDDILEVVLADSLFVFLSGVLCCWSVRCECVLLT